MRSALIMCGLLFALLAGGQLNIGNPFFVTGAILPPPVAGPPPSCTTNLLVIQGIGRTNTTTGATSYTMGLTATNSVLPGALVLVAVVNSKASAPNTPTLAGYGMAWTQIITTNFNTLASPTERLTVFASMTNAEPTTDNLVASFGATQTGCDIRAIQILGTTTNGFTTNGLVQLVANGQNTTANSTITLASLNASGSNAVVAFFGNSLNPYTGTNEVNWIEDTDIGYAIPNTGLYSTYRISTTDNTVTVTNLSSSYAGVAFEINAACYEAPVGGSCATVRVISTPSANSSSDNTTEKWLAGSFTPAYSYTVCKGAVYIKKTGTPAGNMSMAIYTDSAGAPGSSVGTESDQRPATDASTSFDYVNFSNMSCSLTAGTKYWMVFKCSANGDVSNKIDLQFGDVPGFTLQSDNDNGASWSTLGTSLNYWFKLWSD